MRMRAHGESLPFSDTERFEREREHSAGDPGNGRFDPVREGQRRNAANAQEREALQDINNRNAILYRASRGGAVGR